LQPDALGETRRRRSAAIPLRRLEQHHQSARILRTLFAKPGKARILSLACGSCPDFELIVPQLPSLAGAVVLNDADDDALAHSREVLEGIGDRCRIVPGNVMKVARHLGSDGPFDLVLAGGLFDYLPDRAATLLIRTVAERLLAEGGSFFFTNIASGNPYRPLIEYFGDWFLIERSEDDVRRLCREALLPDDAVTIRREETGLALLIDVTST
jgi:hypothetical protein